MIISVPRVQVVPRVPEVSVRRFSGFDGFAGPQSCPVLLESGKRYRREPCLQESRKLMREFLRQIVESRHVFAHDNSFRFETKEQANLIDGEQIDLIRVNGTNVGPRRSSTRSPTPYGNRE